MPAAPLPADEIKRLATLDSLNILDTPSEERFERITRLAQRIFDVPIALISLVDANRQWFKSCQGLDISETPRSVSFCAHAILGDDVLVIPDALNDIRFADNPFVTDEPYIRFYAGCPLVASDGSRLGTLCIIDSQPRHLSENQLDTLRVLAAWASTELNTITLNQALTFQRENEAQIRAVIESVGDGIITFDEHGVIHAFNRAAEEIFGYSAAEIIGQDVTILLPATNRDASNASSVKLLNAGPWRELKAAGHELVGRHKDNSTFFMEVISRELRLPGQRLFIATVRNITYRKHIERELIVARDQALEASRLKSEFLATMSHEIRTPMNSIIGMTELLLDTPLDDEQREFTGIVRDSADALLGIINDILDFSKIEAGKVVLDRVEFVPSVVVEGATELLASKAREKHLSLMTFVDPAIPSALIGDSSRLRQVLVNLIGNAVKFTDRGEVVVLVTQEAATDTDALLRFAVIDTGVGLSLDAQQRLFQPFTQADGSTTRKYGGTGLGLAISKRLVELMGGQIGVQSAPGHGSTFWFTASLARSTMSSTQPPTTAIMVNNLRVLVVDDSSTNRDIVQRYLRAWHLSEDGVSSGAEALDVLRAAAVDGTPYDLAILDLAMPGMDGFAIARAIRRDARIAGTQLILLTAFDERGLGEQALQAGFSAYLTKPIKQAQLLHTISTVSANRERALSSSNAVHGQARSRLPRAEAIKAGQLILLAEDNPVNQKLALTQLERLGYVADAVMNGREAVETIVGGHSQYALVLMDVQMPEMDGLAATKAIRASEVTTGKHVPIIAMTASAMQGDREACIATGMDDYISKPVNRDKLQQVLERWLPAANSMELG